jgi:hypothetical protein
MDNRERQRYDSEVLVAWTMLGMGAVIMLLLLSNMVMDILTYLKK